MVHDQIKEWLPKGARILCTLPTGVLASGMRTKHPNVDIDTCHAGLLLHRPLSEALAILSQYDLVIIDEISMVEKTDFERVVRMWQAAEKLPCLLLVGDFEQLPGASKTYERADRSPLWTQHVYVMEFHEMLRCKGDKTLQRKLAALRKNVPSKQMFRKIRDGHRAWKTKDPDAWDIQKLLRDHPNTTIITVSRQGSAKVNDLAVKVLYENKRKKCLGTADLDWATNHDNYDKNGKLKDTKPIPTATKIYKVAILVYSSHCVKRMT